MRGHHTRWSRRQFLAGVAAATAMRAFTKAHAHSAPPLVPGKRTVYIVPNFHPASCGWLTTFSKERIYCANSYLNHLDRVRDDEHYEFVMSEVNNIIAIMNFKPERLPELHQRIREKRVELVNGFFLESTMNLSSGEALVRLGAEGLRWYERVFGMRPRFAWCIDTCGIHDQMAQIVKGLGLEALIYTRNNPVGQTLFWTVSPDGSRVLTLCPGSYHEARSIFDGKTPFTPAELQKLDEEFATKESITPKGAPLLILGGGADYSLAPKVQSYPTGLLHQWREEKYERTVQFTTLSKYIDTVIPSIDDGTISLQTQMGGTAYDYDAFWIESPKMKAWYRDCEQHLQVAESLATIASLEGQYRYPSQDLYDAWVLMFLNTDRNTLWGSAGGMVYESQASWDVQDRLRWVANKASEVQQSAGAPPSTAESQIALFNPLNWVRNDAIALALPEGTSLKGVTCEALSDGTTLCRLSLGSASVKQVKLSKEKAPKPVEIESIDVIETPYYSLRMNDATGAIASLKLKQSGRELFGAAANVILAERPKVRKGDPGDTMPTIPERQRLGTSNDSKCALSVTRGPLTFEIIATNTFYGGGQLRRVIRLYLHHPRIDFQTELNDIPDNTVVFADFPFAPVIEEVRRGIPFGFSHAEWAKPNADLHGWAKGIVPAVRWTAYSFPGGWGAGLLDRGLTGRELHEQTASIYLLNAEDRYHGYPNSWLSGKGKHVLQYALFPHEGSWRDARVAQAAWEYNVGPALLSGGSTLPQRSYLKTSENVIVESLRRTGDSMVLRLVEAWGQSGDAQVSLNLPHKNAFLADLTGKRLSRLYDGPRYKFPLRPQEIATIVFGTDSSVDDDVPIKKWDAFVPQEKLTALNAYDPNLIGHPPFGD